ncbi:MAG: hypothetical protein AB4050_16885 [Synechococcus sp.]
MSKIVAVHGINKEYEGGNTIKLKWLPNLKDGLAKVNRKLDSEADLTCAFFGDLFRERVQSKARHDFPAYDAGDVNSGWEEDLFRAWFSELERMEAVKSCEDLNATDKGAGKALSYVIAKLCSVKYLNIVSEQVLIHFVKQVHAYLTDHNLAAIARDKLASCIQDDTRILIGHSLGSIVCYEALCEHPDWPIEVFITLGSPLGIPNLIFDRLTPSPIDGEGYWPAGLSHWINLADEEDYVAAVKSLNPLFGGDITDRLVSNIGKSFNITDAHLATRYLTTKECGEAIALGLQ